VTGVQDVPSKWMSAPPYVPSPVAQTSRELLPQMPVIPSC
jgi:hypothetical protein